MVLSRLLRFTRDPSFRSKLALAKLASKFTGIDNLHKPAGMSGTLRSSRGQRSGSSRLARHHYRLESSRPGEEKTSRGRSQRVVLAARCSTPRRGGRRIDGNDTENVMNTAMRVANGYYCEVASV
jgi:hypothetical protein